MPEAPTREIGTESNGAKETPLKAPSLLDGLREKRKALTKERHLELPIPGYDEMLVARYGVVDWDELRRINEKAEKAGPQQVLIAATDILIAACECILMKRDGKLRPLHELAPDFGGEPIRYDSRLAQALEIDADKARGVVWGVFANNLAVVSHFNDVMTWMQDGSVEVDRDFATRS